MLIQSTTAEQRTVLNNVSWNTFEALLKDTGEHRGARFAYDCGTLEIMSPGFLHENTKGQFDHFIIVLAELFNTELISAGSTTLKLETVKSAIEPDQSYYIQNWQLMRGKRDLDLNIVPPPDLAIQIDITPSGVNKFDIYAALKVPELWRYNGEVLQFYQLVEKQYIEIKSSLAFPLISGNDISRFIEQSYTLGEIAVIRLFRDWVMEKIQ